MLDLGRPDPERQRAQPAMGAGMAVAANEGRARQAEAQLRPDDVDDPLFGRERVDIGEAELSDIASQRRQLRGAVGSAIGSSRPFASTRAVVGRL